MKWILIVILNGQPMELSQHDKYEYCKDFAIPAAMVYDKAYCIPRGGRNNG